jgi:hypothetical protein
MIVRQSAAGAPGKNWGNGVYFQYISLVRLIYPEIIPSGGQNPVLGIEKEIELELPTPFGRPGEEEIKG